MHIPRSGLSTVSDTTGLQFSTDEIGWYALGPTIAITLLASAVVALRWYTRAIVARCIGKDDLIILVSMVLGWIMCIIMGIEFDMGLGTYDRREVDTEQLTKLVMANNDIWCLATNVTKASILAQYLRVFSSPCLRYICAMILTLCALSACWGIFGGTWLCQPMEKLWKPELPGHCMDALSYWISAAAVNSALDLLVLILPLPWIMSLHLPYRQKMCISTLFLLGFLVCLISVIRFTTVYVEAVRGDHIKSGMYAILWSAVEVNIGIICACLIALKPLIARWFPGVLEESTDSRGSGTRWWHRSGGVSMSEPEVVEVCESNTPDCSNTRPTVQMTRVKVDSGMYEHGVLDAAGIKVRDFGSDTTDHP